MPLKNEAFKIDVTSEIGTLRALLIHSPDSGLGKVVPSKAQDWLFEDIVHLDTVRKNAYDHYAKLMIKASTHQPRWLRYKHYWPIYCRTRASAKNWWHRFALLKAVITGCRS